MPMIVCSIGQARVGAVAHRQSRKIRCGSRQDRGSAKVSVQSHDPGMFLNQHDLAV